MSSNIVDNSIISYPPLLEATGEVREYAGHKTFSHLKVRDLEGTRVLTPARFSTTCRSAACCALLIFAAMLFVGVWAVFTFNCQTLIGLDEEECLRFVRQVNRPGRP